MSAPDTSPRAVLFDRDGTLIADIPYNADPSRVRPMVGARAALDRIRRAGLAVGVVSNQSGVARGLLSVDQVSAVNARVEALLGPFDVWKVCFHGPSHGCECRKPKPGLVLDAAEVLGVSPRACVVVGDIGSDMDAAAAAGARGILVPTPNTNRDEVVQSAVVAADLESAVDHILGASA